jgi:sulfate adenylyltransferase subunit 1
MATGASTADLAIILVDARKGILTQSRRHAYIAALLGIRHFVVAVNKMDLVDFSEAVYRRIESDFSALAEQFGHASVVTIPVSALNGDNVVEHSLRTPWYSGLTLLEYIEQVPADTYESNKAFRMSIQRVIRPDYNYRGFAGQIASGTIRTGDPIVVLPSGRTSRISSITTFGGDLDEAIAPQSIAVTLEDELDISRGDVMADPMRPPESGTDFEASLVWFDESPLVGHKPYLLKHGAQTFNARTTRVLHRVNMQTLEQETVHTLGMNDVGIAEIATTRPIFFDPYAHNRTTGSFILIDPATNATSAAGMIRRSVSQDTTSAMRKQHGALILLPDTTWTSEVEQILLDEGFVVVRTRVKSKRLWLALLRIGAIVLLEGIAQEVAHELVEEIPIEVLNFSDYAPGTFLRELRQRNILPPQKESQP